MKGAGTFLACAAFALALLAVLLRGAASGLGAEVDSLLVRRRALERSLGETSAEVERLRSPGQVAGRLPGLREPGGE